MSEINRFLKFPSPPPTSNMFHSMSKVLQYYFTNQVVLRVILFQNLCSFFFFYFEKNHELNGCDSFDNVFGSESHTIAIVDNLHLANTITVKYWVLINYKIIYVIKIYNMFAYKIYYLSTFSYNFNLFT